MLAYLDPGSGSALVGTLIAVAGASIYSLKSFIYRLLRKDDGKSKVEPDIAIFSEGRNYWGTWKLIVEELISRKVHFAYCTMDLHDPALLIDDECMHSHLYDKDKAASYQKLSRIKARVLLATTPNIGTEGFPIRRSKDVKKMLHVFHAFADVSAYHLGSLDHYDVVLMVGPHQEKYIREVEAARNLTPKRMISVGLPYFDAQYLALSKTFEYSEHANSRTILVAPSWGSKGCLMEYGIGFVCKLAEAGYRVIIRPHPQSFIAEPKFIAECQFKTGKFENVVWDREAVGTKSMETSDLLISDTSSIRFDYAFLYGKPVVTLDIPRASQKEYDGVYQKSLWTDEAAAKLGRVLGLKDVDQIVQVVGEVLSSGARSDVLDFRSATITNLGTSAQAIADVLIKEVENA